MPDTDAMTIVKRFTWRGATEEWSNTYHLEGTTPTSDATWKALADAIIASEKTCFHAGHSVVRAYGYASGDPDHAAWSYDYLAAGTSVPGTFATGSAPRWAGDQAGWIRAKRVGLSATGKPVYCRKYFHGGTSATTSDGDAMGTGLATAYVAHANTMLGGTLPGSMKWCAPQGGDLSAPIASTYVTTRTLKRRGRRPTPAP